VRTLDRAADVDPDATQRSRSVRKLVATVVLAMVGMWLLSAIALVIYSGGFREPSNRELLIPPGTNEMIAAGANPLNIPPEWEFISGDTLGLVNDDSVDHWVGSWFVPAGERLTVELVPAYAGLLTCSVHPSGSIEISVEPRGFDWGLTAFPAIVLGLPLGLVIGGVGRVMGALGSVDDRDE